MTNLIDKFEEMVLNNSRRIISVAIFILLLMGVWNFFGGILNTIDGPNVEADDAPRMPEFTIPIDISSFSDEAEESDTEVELVEEIEEDFEKELNKLAQIHAALYVSAGWFDNVETSNESIRDYIKAEIDSWIYGYGYSEKQKEAWVDGYIDYSYDFKDYIVDKYDWNYRNPTMGSSDDLDSYDLEYLERPVDQYAQMTVNSFDDHDANVLDAAADAAANNVKGAAQLMKVAIVIGIVIALVLILLIFKAENSLRRSADSMEKS